MKRSFKFLTLLTLAVFVGCGAQGTPGGPGTSAKKPTMGQAEDTFNLSVPLMATTIQQGDTLETKIGIERAKNFQEDVALKFVDLPAGVTIEPAEPMIKHGDTDAKIAFQVAEGAPLGDFKIKVTGHPTKGSDALVDFKLAVAANDSFTLTVPLLSTSLKQGESKDVAIGIKRAGKFDQDVALSFSELPTGITLEPSTPMIRKGETEAQITLTGAADASLGKFEIKVTGHPTEGADASNQLNLSIAKSE